MVKYVAAAALAVGIAGMAMAQDKLVGPDQFPEFRGMSGLPGSGFALGKDGHPNPHGALSFSTPIGYALGKGHFVAGGSTVSDSLSPQVSFGNNNHSNGTAEFMYGIDLKEYGNLTAAYMVLSSFGDGAINVQYQPKLNLKMVDFSIGVQDENGGGGSAGQDIPGDNDSSRSYFIAGTADLGHNQYLSAGWGTRRYQKGFASYSFGLGEDFRVVAEHDGFNFNAGVAYTMPYEEDRKDRSVTVYAGLTRMQYLTLALTVSY